MKLVQFVLLLLAGAAFFGAPIALLASCSPAPSAQRPDAAGDAAVPPPVPGDIYDRACANLARLGCPVGADPHCADALRRSPDELPVSISVELAAAPSKEAIRAVGSYPGHPGGFVECP